MKTKLTPAIQTAIIELIEGGNFKRTAAAACGISESTLYLWIQKGEEAKSGKYFEFSETIKRSEAKAEAMLIAKINRAAIDPKTWQAAAWILERSRFKDWGKKDTLDLNAKIEDVTPQKLENLTTEELRKLSELLAKAEADPATG